MTCETDFVQKNERFVDLVHSLTEAFHKQVYTPGQVSTSMSVGMFDFDKLRDMPVSNGRTFGDHIAEAVGVIGENVVLRRAMLVTSPLLASYIHSVSVPARDLCQVGPCVNSVHDLCQLSPE